MSERELSRRAGISRGALRKVEAGEPSSQLRTVTAVANALGLRTELVCRGEEGNPDCSSIAVSIKVSRDGFETWKQYFMDLVDEYRRTLDPHLLLLPPSEQLHLRLRALLSGIVWVLSEESGISVPPWARRSHFLPTPWFVSESEALKASALLESPLAFRRNNVFVLSNMMERM